MKMSITVNFPARVEAQVQTEAARQQMTPEDYVLHVVTQSLPEEGEAARRERVRELLRSVEDIGDEDEQRETFAYLQQAVDADRLSDRKRFA